VFEDSPFGVEAALAAGMQVVALPDPAMDRARYRNADVVASCFADLSLAALGL
jgi:pseudouridine-5'-monophosphatase